MTKYIIMLLLAFLLNAGLIQAQNIDAREKKTKPKVYIVHEVTVHDSVTYEQFRIKIQNIIKKYGGRYLVRSGGMSFDNNQDNNIVPLGGNWNPDRFIIIQYDSIEQYQNLIKSDEYINILKLRGNSATMKSIMVREYIENKEK